MKIMMRTMVFYILYFSSLLRSFRFYFFIGKYCFIRHNGLRFITLILPSFEDRFTVLDIYGKKIYDDKSINQFISSAPGTITIYDFGANIGCSSVFFQQRYPKSKLYTVEPDPSNFQFLECNLRHFSDVHSIKGALTPSNIQEISLIAGTTGNSHQVIKGQSDGTPIVCITDLLKLSLTDINIAKVDIEGFENAVFSTDYDSWDLFDLIMIELHDWMGGEISSTSFLKFIAEHKRRTIIKGDIVYSYRGDLNA